LNGVTGVEKNNRNWATMIQHLLMNVTE